MTGLPYESAQTTGTVAVAKWGRVTLLSPRASHHGYAWRDTIAHELTHLARHARVARPRAALAAGGRREARGDPLARAGPVRRPALARERRAARARAEARLPLDKLGPEHRDAAERRRGDGRVRRGDELRPLLRRRPTGPTTRCRSSSPRSRRARTPTRRSPGASGADLKAWDARWRAYLAAQRPREPLPELFGLGGEGTPTARAARPARARTGWRSSSWRAEHAAGGADGARPHRPSPARPSPPRP